MKRWKWLLELMNWATLPLVIYQPHSSRPDSTESFRSRGPASILVLLHDQQNLGCKAVILAVIFLFC